MEASGSFWNTRYRGDVETFSDAQLHQLFVNYDFPKPEGCRKAMERAANELLEDITDQIELTNVINMENLDPSRLPEYRYVNGYRPYSAQQGILPLPAWPAEVAFNRSWPADVLAHRRLAHRREPHRQPTVGMNPELDLIMNVLDLFQGTDNGVFLHSIQLPGSPVQSKGVVLRVQRVLEYKSTICLEVVYVHGCKADINPMQISPGYLQ
jgi:hypothetical protein